MMGEELATEKWLVLESMQQMLDPEEKKKIRYVLTAFLSWVVTCVLYRFRATSLEGPWDPPSKVAQVASNYGVLRTICNNA